MFHPVLPSKRPKWRFSSNVLLSVGSVTIVAIALTTVALVWTARHSDRLSVERQIQITYRALDTSINRLVRQQQTVAVWDLAVQELNKAAPDWQWVDDWIGVRLCQMFGQDQVFILNPHNEPVYAAIDGARAPASHYYVAWYDIHSLVDAIRTPDEHTHAKGLRRHLQLGSATPVAEKVVSHAHFLNVNGRLSIVSAIKIVPLTKAVEQAPGREFILVSIRFLGAAFLNQLSDEHLIRGPRFSSTATIFPGESAVPLSTDDGEDAGYFIWQPELPGTMSLRVLGPVITVVLGVVVFMMALLARSLRSSVSDLKTTVVELKASEAHAQHLASHDVLTGLPNRILFNKRLEQALARIRSGEKLAVLTLDLDRFKNVNDTHGHLAGDELIRDFASRLAGLLRETDTAARLGGDEFAIVQAGVRDKHDVEALCARILEAVRRPFDLYGRHAFVGVSIGVVLAPEAGSDRVDLMRKADIALYHAKAAGRNCHHYFTAAMDETVKLRVTIEEELRAALAAGDGLRLLYQPQVTAAGQRVIGFEALVRWQHPTQGLISPGQFVPIAEEAGLIGPLGEWVLRQACATSKRFPDQFVAVNLSPVQIRSIGFVERVIAIVRESGADPHRIELEVTEGILLDDDKAAHKTLTTLREAGFRIALDDFGTGYSSLSYLRHFEVDKIKIDRSFVQHLGQAADDGSAAIVTSIISLGRALGLTVTAEGVETEDQRQFLEAAGCLEMQGYLFCRPVSENHLINLSNQMQP